MKDGSIFNQNGDLKFTSESTITLTYFFSQNLSAHTFFNYNIKNSDDSYMSAYYEYNGCLGANLNFSF